MVSINDSPNMTSAFTVDQSISINVGMPTINVDILKIDFMLN